MENSKIPRQQDKTEKKSTSFPETALGIKSFTPPPTGIDSIPVQEKNSIQLMQEETDEEKPEYFQANAIQRLQDLPEEERPEVLQPSLIQKMHNQKAEKEVPPFTPDSSIQMPEDVRAKMENAFHADFSNVSIHEGSNATNINALAYTQGNDIHFAPGQFQPHSQQGQELLGHELAHVLQQQSGRVQPTTQKKGVSINDSPQLEQEADEMGKKAAAGKEIQLKSSSLTMNGNTTNSIQLKGEETEGKISFIFRVYIDSMVDSDELLILFIQQYQKVDRQTALQLKEEQGWHWIGQPKVITEKDLANKFIDLNVSDGSLSPLTDSQKSETQKQFDGLSKEEKDAINREADKQFWNKTNYKEGQKLNPVNPSDKIQAEYWKTIRAKLLQQKAQLDNLPVAVKDFLKAPENFQPQNYEVLSRIADKLNQFNIADFSDYKSKINAETDDLLELEKSIDRYLAEKHQREQQQEEKEKIATRLYGLEELYKQYQLYRTLLTTSSINAASGTPMGVGTSLGSQSTINKLREELETNAKKNGFSGLSDFEQKIKEYEEAFKKETVSIGMDALAKYEHILFEEEKKYKNQVYINQLFEKIAPAKSHYETAQTEQWNSIFAGMSNRDHLTDDQIKRQLEHSHKAEEARKQGDDIVSSQADEQSILREEKFDKESAATAKSPSELQGILLKYIQDKRARIAETRENLKDTELVYKLEKLLSASYAQQGIAQRSIYDMIVKDKVRDIKITETIINVAAAIFSIALGFLTFGSGTIVGLAAGSAVFGISAWQAYEEYSNYVKLNDASAVGFTEDPSLVWVIISIAGAGLDAAAVTSSIKALAAPAKIFNETKDVVTFEKTLAQITQVDARIKQKVLEAAKAEAKYQEALTDMTKASAKLYSTIIGDPEVYKEFVKVAYYAAKKGIIKFEQYLLELRLNKLIKEADQLKPEELSRLKEAFEEGQKEFKENPKLYEQPTTSGFEEITAPNGVKIKAAVKDNALVPVDKVEIYARGKVKSVKDELRELRELKQTNRKLFDSNPQNADRLDKLIAQNKNYDRSIAMSENLNSIGLTDSVENNKIITEHLLEVGNKINPENRVWYPSILEGPNGKLQVHSTWIILPDGRTYLSTLRFMPIK